MSRFVGQGNAETIRGVITGFPLLSKRKYNYKKLKAVLRDCF